MKIEDYSKYYIQGSDHYLVPKDVFKELFNEMLNWKKNTEKQQDVIDKAIMHINLNKQKTICAYGDNEDDDFEIELWEEDIDKLLDILKEVFE